MATRDKKQFTSKNKIIALSIAVVILGPLVVYLGIIRPVQVRLERREFMSAKSHVEQLQTDIVSVAGTPDDTMSDNYCSYSSALLEGGRLSCTTVIRSRYKNVSSEHATKTFNDITSKLGAQKANIGANSFVKFVPKDQFRGDQDPGQELPQYKSMFCAVDYNYPSKLVLDSPFGPSDTDDLQLSISCGKEALAPHFPLKK